MYQAFSLPKMAYKYRAVAIQHFRNVHHWRTAAPDISLDEYVARRRAVLSSMPPNSMALFPAAPTVNMTEDVPYLYHPSTDLLYLTGCLEPGALLMLDTTEQARRSDVRCGLGQSLLFVRPKDPRHEQWEGPMHGTGEETRDLFGVDAVHANHSLPHLISERIELDQSRSSLRHFFFNPHFNGDVTAFISQLQGRKGNYLASVWSRGIAAKKLVCQARLVKSPSEIALLRIAASYMSNAFNNAMAFTVTKNEKGLDTGIHERQIEAILEYSCKMQGANRMSFPCVVASGKNGTVLHYMANSDKAKDGDFVMVDAGCQYKGYCSDVSRSWPVNGRFSSAQRLMYELILDVQFKCIEMARVGNCFRGERCTLNSIHSFAVEQLTAGLMDLGFMKGLTLEEAVSSRAYSNWFDHSIGHYLGMDVHDTHSVSKDLPLVAGMCITIEPGLYVRHDDESAPREFRGIGMRVEVSHFRQIFHSLDNYF